MRKIFTLILLTSMALTACSSQEVPTNTVPTSTIKSESTNVQMSTLDTYYPVTITTYNYDMEPVEITFTEAPKNVVAVYQNSIETLLALGLEDTIVYASGLDHEVKDEFIFSLSLYSLMIVQLEAVHHSIFLLNFFIKASLG